MNLIFENWRRYQLNEIFNSPVPDKYIRKVIDDYSGSQWIFFVDGKSYDIAIAEFMSGLTDVAREFEIEFSHKGEYEPTNYGVNTGIKVMSTVIKLLVDWIRENGNNFFLIVSNSDDRNRTLLYNRILKTIPKKLGNDYAVGFVDGGGDYGAVQMIVNVGFVEREVDKFIEKSDFKSARKIVSEALSLLYNRENHEGDLEEITERIYNQYDKIREAQMGDNDEAYI